MVVVQAGEGDVVVVEGGGWVGGRGDDGSFRGFEGCLAEGG